MVFWSRIGIVWKAQFRDQVLQTRQFEGTTSSSTYQDVTMTYDGFGRMKTRHYPIEDAQTETTWNYNLDDSIYQIIDPRYRKCGLGRILSTVM